MASSPEPKDNKDLLDMLYLKHGLTQPDNTHDRGRKYDLLVTEYNDTVNGKLKKKQIKKYFDNQKQIKKKSQSKNFTAQRLVDSDDTMDSHPDSQNSDF